MISAGQYWALREEISKLGYHYEILWSEDIKPISDPFLFWAEYSWVVLNSGMKNQIAQKIWDKVRPVVMDGNSALSVFGHKSKASAIDAMWSDKEKRLAEYQQALDKIAWLERLSWIGKITKWHLAKNYGIDCAKPDRHLVRIAGNEGVTAMCKRLSDTTTDRIATVDQVIWRAANLGLI